MSNRESCTYCPLGDQCEIQNPQTIEGDYANVFISCRHFTCPAGARSALMALKNMEPTFFVINGNEEMLGVPFGTIDKPTAPSKYSKLYGEEPRSYSLSRVLFLLRNGLDDDTVVHRFISHDRRIYSADESGVFRFTGRTLERKVHAAAFSAVTE